MKWQILLTPTALNLLADISDRRIREKIGAVIDRLTEDPEKQGKALLGELQVFAVYGLPSNVTASSIRSEVTILL